MGLKIAWIFFMYTFVFGTFRDVSITPYIIRAFSNNRTVIGKVASYGGPVTMILMVVPVLCVFKLSSLKKMLDTPAQKAE